MFMNLKNWILQMQLLYKVTCEFILQENTKEWSELNTFKPIKTTISSTLLAKFKGSAGILYHHLILGLINPKYLVVYTLVNWVWIYASLWLEVDDLREEISKHWKWSPWAQWFLKGLKVIAMSTVILKGIVDKSYDRLGHKHIIPKIANFFKS